MNQCIRLMESLVTFSFNRPVKEVQLALVGVINILGNLRSVMKKFKNLVYEKIFHIILLKLKTEYEQLFKQKATLLNFRLCN
jgi:hypothetical protein